ncbi:MAG: hypothetical protein ABFR36_02150 [Acidobacteriota bacterium]
MPILLEEGEVEEERKYIISCWHCGAEFNAFDSTFCCHFEPTPLCLFCYRCLCDASEEYREKVLREAPAGFIEMKKKAIGRREMKLGELLLNEGRISQADLEVAISMQSEMKVKLGEVLIRMKLITAEELELFLLDQKDIQETDIGHYLPDPFLVEKIGAEFCLRVGMIPIEVVEIDEKKILNFAIAKKENIAQIRLCEELSDYILLPSLGKPDEMENLLAKIRAIKEVEDILLLK